MTGFSHEKNRETDMFDFSTMVSLRQQTWVLMTLNNKTDNLIESVDETTTLWTSISTTRVEFLDQITNPEEI